ncbi:MAG: ABC transporter ATP-binding protein [Planctomycetes bacterium]|nr:ABC transporter ATP-binding protein [Planctomycetota bacterium]
MILRSSKKPRGVKPAKANEADSDADEVRGAALDPRLLRRLLEFAKPHKALFLSSFAVLLLGFLLELLGPFVIRMAIDGPIQMGIEERITAGDARWQLGTYVLGFLAIVLTLGFVRYGEITLMTRTGQATILDIRRRLYRHLQKQPLAFYDRNAVGKLVTRTTSDVEALNELFTSGVVTLLRDLLKIVGILAILFAIHAKLALISLAFAPVLIGVSMVFRTKARESYREVRGKLSRLNAYLTEAIGGVRIAQLFGREEKVKRRFRDHTASYFVANIRTIFFFAVFFPALDLVIYTMESGVFAAGASGLHAATLTKGELLQFWIYLEMLVQPIRELGEKYNILQAAMASSERIFNVLDEKPQLRAPAEVKAPSERAGRIVFDRVSFAYTPEAPVLRNVSFTVEPGQTVAVVGATGAGKSTIISLLMRYYDVDTGSVSVDGVDVRHQDLGDLRKSVGLVSQDVLLFTGTIAENVSLHRTHVTEEDVRRAAETVCANRFIERLSGGYDARVAERGATFSTGERQLIAFARALAGQPRIIVLDEATAHVDTQTEAWIQEGITHLLEDRTAIVIAHRLSTVRAADKILVLHHGEVREQGTHPELMALGGIYSRLYSLQFQQA